MSNKSMDYRDFSFHFLEDLEHPLLQFVALGKQSRAAKDYYWDNSDRPESFLFQYTLSGSGVVEMNGHRQNVNAGDFFVLHLPGDSKYYYDDSSNEAWEFIYIMVSGGSAYEYCKYIENHHGNIFFMQIYNACVGNLMGMYDKAIDNAYDDLFNLTKDVMGFLCLMCSEASESDSVESNVAIKACDYYDRNYKKDIGVVDAAAYLKVSQSHLSREFYKQYSEKPIEYLTRLRVKEAVRLLTTKNNSVNDIARECGFSSSNYFAKVFKKHMGMSPGAFKDYIKRGGFSTIKL